ncbi:MAG: LysM peptidoglycan-binding domain-containing protein [Verrucomicrobiales bacterium]
MKSLMTILKVFAGLGVIAVLALVVFALKQVSEEFGQPQLTDQNEVANVLEQNQISDFEPGQREFNRAMELIALGELAEAREKLLYIQNLFPNSLNGPEARRILGEMNMDELLSVNNMENKSVHVVKSGDSYLAIAKKYETTIDCLVFLNGLTEMKTLHPGDEFVVMPLNFTLQVDVPNERLRLFRKDDEKKENVFVKEYLVQSMDLPRMRGSKLQTEIYIKRGERHGMVYSTTSAGYRGAQKVLMLKRPALQIRPVPEADGDDPGRGFFLKMEDLEELALLLRLGNEVEILL